MALTLTPWDNVSSFVDEKGILTLRAQAWLQTALKQLYDEFGALEAAQQAQQAAQAANAAATAANNAAGNAQTAADNAQGAAEQASADSSLASSGVTGLTMTAEDAGPDAQINISAHTRVYGDGTSVAVNSGFLSALAYDTVYYVFYSDPDRSGGSVSYQASTNANDAAQIGAVHSLGTVKTPVAAGPPVPALPNPPPGVQDWR